MGARASGAAKGDAEGLHTRTGAPMRLEGACADVWRPVTDAVADATGTRCGSLCWEDRDGGVATTAWAGALSMGAGAVLVSCAPHCPQATRGLTPPSAVLVVGTPRAALRA